MKDCHVRPGFRELGASYCASLREHLNKTAVSPEGGPGQQAQCARTGGLRVHICARMRTRAAGATPGLSGQPRRQAACIKCSVIHKAGWWSWGRGGIRACAFFWVGPLGRSGSFGLSGPRLVLSGAALGLAGIGGSPQVPACPRGSGGPAWAEVLGRPSSVLKPNASQSRENGEVAGDLTLDTGRKHGPCQALEQGPGCRTVPSHLASTQSHPRVSRGGPALGRAGPALAVRRRSRSAGLRVSARCTVCTWQRSPRRPGPPAAAAAPP